MGMMPFLRHLSISTAFHLAYFIFPSIYEIQHDTITGASPLGINTTRLQGHFNYLLRKVSELLEGHKDLTGSEKAFGQIPGKVCIIKNNEPSTTVKSLLGEPCCPVLLISCVKQIQCIVLNTRLSSNNIITSHILFQIRITQ